MAETRFEKLTAWLSTVPGIFAALAALIGPVAALGTAMCEAKYQICTAPSGTTTGDAIRHLVRSESGKRPAVGVNFVNASGAALDVVWINTDGAEKPVERITAGGTYSLTTYAKHLILVKEATTGEHVLLLNPRGNLTRAFTVEIASPEPHPQ